MVVATSLTHAAYWNVVIHGDSVSAFVEGPRPSDVFIEQNLEDGWKTVLTL